MGILDDIGYLVDGELSANAVQGQIESMITISSLGPPTLMGVPLGIGVPNSDLSYMSVTGTLDEHEERFPQFHGININFMKSAVQVLNLQPVNVLKNLPIPITDPTQPLVELILGIRSAFEDIVPPTIDVELLLMEKLPAIASEIQPFIEFLNNEILANADDLSVADVSVLLDLLDIIFEDNQQVLDNIKLKISEEKADLLGTLLTSAQNLLGLSGEMPDISIPNPLFSLEMIGLPPMPEIPAILFTLGPPPGILGFLVNFLQQMAIEIGLKIAELQVPTVALDMIAALEEGIEGIINFIIDFFLGPIKSALLGAWPDIEDHVIPAAFFAGFMLTALKIIIVAVIGILLGPGLIAFSAAKALELI